MKKITLAFLICVLSTPSTNAMNLIGRLGIGMSQQLASGMETISFKLQQSRAMGIGGLLGLNSNSDATTYAVGGKIYRIIYDEPQLNFYTGGLAAFFNYENPDGDEGTSTGSQLEAVFGAEFSFQGLESVGFSFEFGAGLINYNDVSSFQTVGHNVLKSAVHFYL